MRKKLGSYLKLILMIKYYGMNRYGRSSMLLLSASGQIKEHNILVIIEFMFNLLIEINCNILMANIINIYNNCSYRFENFRAL